MEINSSANNKKMPGETLAEVLYKGAWCILGLSILHILTGLFIPAYSKMRDIFNLLTIFYGPILIAGGALVLLGISAIIKATNQNTLEIRKLIQNQKQ